ncbi:MAG: DUF4301 family protein [Elusimicrobiota bacterium]
MITERDLEQVHSHGIKTEEVLRQAALLTDPPPFLPLDRPCALGDGILSLDAPALERLAVRAERTRLLGRMMRFIPASGRASRMFHAFHSLCEGSELEPGEEAEVKACLEGFKNFAFYKSFKADLHKSGLELDRMLKEGRAKELAQALTGGAATQLSDSPKALLPFHEYAEGGRTAFEEHLLEGAAQLRDKNGACRLHFTISAEHKTRFDQHLAALLPKLEPKLGVKFAVSFSVQGKGTDTLAMGLDNEPYRSPEGKLLFWAGGHGALLHNLQRLHADIVFIRNVDNAVPDRLKPARCRHDLAMAGMVIELQDELYAYLPRVYSKAADETALDEALRFGRERLGVVPPGGWDAFTREDRRSWLIDRLDRPIRVCGVVPSAGEPGGGPFWVREKEGLSLQIVERAQVDPSSEEQGKVFAASTHFNPVDMVCGLRDYLDEPFRLERFVDKDAVFLAEKSWEGKKVKVVEHPGLWNGSMSRWHTVFVEMPLEMFQPAKRLSDLLRQGHTV